MIEVVKLNKEFGQKQIFKDFSCKFEKGKMYGIKGASGSGKSTLLNILGQIDLEYEGDLFINECHVNRIRKQTKQILKEEIFYLFQNYALVDDKTVEQNLKIITDINPAFRSHVLEALQQVGLDESYLKMPVYALSGGEQQRVSLSRVFLRHCNIVLADEPTGNLDQKNAQNVFNILAEMARIGKTVIVASHDEEILNGCDVIISL